MKDVIFLMGPTASGKTDVAIKLYNKPIEIISVDSVLIYKEMNIGTAKPDTDTLLKFPHHLVDIINPNEEYSVKSFVTDTLNIIDNAHKKGKTPILVGGTSFYFHALEHGLSNLPTSTFESRKWVNDLLDNKGLDFAYKYLSKVDINKAKHLHPNDSQRISRALEVYYISGQPLSSFQGKKIGYLSNYTLKKFALMPDKIILNKRIETRFHQMIHSGFVEEVETLVTKYNLNMSHSSLRAVGYKQVWQYLQGEYSLNECIARGIIATRQLAKKQRTWLRSSSNLSYITDESKILSVLE